MKSILFLFLGMMALTGCQVHYPNHIGIEPSMEWELQEGTHMKTKPKIIGRINWNM